MTESNNIKKFLRSEITWLISFGAFVYGAVITVVLPLQALQIQANQTAKDLTEIRSAQSDIPQIKTEHALIRQELNQLEVKLDKHVEKI